MVPGALESRRVSIADCRQLAAARTLPGLETALQTLDQRFARIKKLWAAGQLAGIASASTLPRRARQQAIERPPRWDPERFATALIPALAFIIGYLFWIYPTDPPPAGQSNGRSRGFEVGARQWDVRNGVWSLRKQR